MIEAHNVTFDYPGTRALDDVTFSVPAGTITALVGPNGAGKTTLLRCLAALDEPIRGSIRIDGVDVRADPRDCHRRVGYLSDFFGLYEELTARQSLTYMAGAHGLASREQARAVERAADLLRIRPQLDTKASDLSRGLRQRLAIAQSILHRPRVLLLDEPASGLDPDARHELAALFLDLQADGMTLLVSSHILAELSDYSSRMMILREGSILEHRALEDFASPAREIHLRLAHGAPELRERLSATEGIEDLRIEGLIASFRFAGDEAEQGALLRRLVEAGLPVCAFGEARANLQDLYLEKVKDRDEEVAP